MIRVYGTGHKNSCGECEIYFTDDSLKLLEPFLNSYLCPICRDELTSTDKEVDSGFTQWMSPCVIQAWDTFGKNKIKVINSDIIADPIEFSWMLINIIQEINERLIEGDSSAALDVINNKAGRYL